MKGEREVGEGRTPSMVPWEHHHLWVVLREDLAQLESQIGGYGASLISLGMWGYDNNHHILLSMSLLQFLKGLGGGRINKYLHYSKGKKKKVLHTTAHKYTQLRV